MSLLRFTGECRALSNFDGQVSLARFTGEQHVPGDGHVSLVRCALERAYLKQLLSSTLEIRTRVVEHETASAWSYLNIEATV